MPFYEIIIAVIKNILAIDLGKGSIGLALSRSGSLVTPLKEVRFPGGHYEVALSAIKELLVIEKVERFVVGYPLFPSGDPCEMTPIVEDFIDSLNDSFPDIPVEKQDERNSTVEAAALLHQQGKNAKKQKKNIDSAAAAVILMRYLKRIGQMDD